MRRQPYYFLHPAFALDTCNEEDADISNSQPLLDVGFWVDSSPLTLEKCHGTSFWPPPIPDETPSVLTFPQRLGILSALFLTLCL